MPRDLTPEPDERALLASAHADGTLSAEQRERFEGEPAVRAHAELVAELREWLREPLDVAAAERDTSIAAALEAMPPNAAVVPIGRSRRWTTPVLAVAAAAVLLGVVGVTVIGSGGGGDDEASSARVSDEIAVASDAEAATAEAGAAPTASDGSDTGAESAPVTIASIDAPASAVLLVDDPVGLAALPVPLTSGDSKIAVSYSPAAGCLTDGQVFLADIVYRGVPAIAVRTVDGTTLAVDATCSVIGEARP